MLNQKKKQAKQNKKVVYSIKWMEYLHNLKIGLNLRSVNYFEYEDDPWTQLNSSILHMYLVLTLYKLSDVNE